MQYLWGLINSLQMVIHMPLLDINMPSNANYVFLMLISIVTLDLFPSEDVLNALFTFPDSIPFNDRFDNLDIFQNCTC